MIPYSVAATTREGLSRLILGLQTAQGGAKIQIISIYWDGRNHVCWYFPLRDKE